MPAQLALLDRLTIIIEGPYLPGRRVGIRWRGSSNQRIHLLGGGHAEVRDARDEPAGMTFEVTGGWRAAVDGVPLVRGFRGWLERDLARDGIGVGGGA